MSDAPSSARLPSITARPNAEEKRRFAQLASSRGMSESMLALVAIQSLLESNALLPEGAVPADERAPATDRITIRLRPGDRLAIKERAARRGLKDSTYLAALVRAHVSRNPPLPANELAMLKKLVAILAGIRSRLGRQCSNWESSENIQAELRQTQVVVAGTERVVRDFARAALESWESGYG